MSGPEAMMGMTVLAIPIVAIISRSDIGRAIADAIRHNSGANEGAAARRELEQMRAEIEQVRLELDDVHAQLMESHERLDFAERILAKAPEAERMPMHRTPV